MTPYYAEDGITIYHGDCREVLPQLGCADVLLTDPPYGILAETGSAATRRSGGNTDNGRMAWDVAPTESHLRKMQAKAVDSMIWGGCHLPLPPTFGYLIWDKQIDGLNFGEAEFCWTSFRMAPRIYRYRAVGVDGGKVHPTQKPLALMQWCLSFSRNSRSVLDPFMGTGTTLEAAKLAGMTAVGIEMDEKYCEIAAKRLAQRVFEFTGE